jgi:hypothetical protein
MRLHLVLTALFLCYNLTPVLANQPHSLEGISISIEDGLPGDLRLSLYDFEDLPAFEEAQNDPLLLRKLLQKSPPPSLIPFQNPQLNPNLERIEAKNNDVNLIPEGLTAIGDVDPHRKTMIYFHGWTQDGAAETLFFPEKWHEAGYNTFIFRWHRDSYEVGLIPLEAEQRIYKQVGERAIREILRLQLSLGADYDQEVVFVAHSLGTGLLLYVDLILSQFKHPLAPDRIDILDPFVSSSYLPDDSPLFDHPAIKGKSSVYLREMLGNQARSRNGLDQVPISVYSSLIGFYSSYEIPMEDQPDRRHLLGMWDGVRFIALTESPSFTAKIFDIFQELFAVIQGSQSKDDVIALLIGQHGLVRPYYFGSIDTPPIPLNNSSFPIILASTPLATLKKMPSLIYEQVEGGETLDDPLDDRFILLRRERCDRRVEGFNILCFNF